MQTGPTIDREAAARALGEWFRDHPTAGVAISAFRIDGDTRDYTDLREADMLVLVDVVLSAALQAYEPA